MMNNNNTQSNCTIVEDALETSAASAAGDAAAAAAAADATTSTATATAALPEFVQLTETRRYIYRAIAAIHDESFNKLMIRLLRQFECAIRESFESAQRLPPTCRRLAHSIIALTDQIHRLLARRALDSSNTRQYQQRMSFIVATYIACELCAAQERVESERCVLERISSMLSLYVEVADVGSGALKEHTLRTLVAIPKVFGQASIITVLYSRLFPQWSATYSVFSQAELPDKIFIEYIIIFYCWQRLERDEATRQRILEFAGKFMRPSTTLPFNATYLNYLPDYSAPRTATRVILDHLNLVQSCTGLRAASRLDNRLTQSNEFILDSDEEKAAAESSSVMVSAMAAAITTTITPLPPPAPDPPEFLRVLCDNANRLEPVVRAAALYRGIDSLREVVDLCESDEDVEMFSLDFSVPANVDANGSSSNDAATIADDDNVPITRIFPSNLRTYQRFTSGAVSSAAPGSSATATATYTMPRIVNSYSCRRDSLHLVSTTQTPSHLVDQCVQTAELEQDQMQAQEFEQQQDEDEQQRQHQQQHQQQQQQQLLCFDEDATSTCIPYPNNGLSASTTTSTTTELLYAGSNRPIGHYHSHHNIHCQQPSSRNSNSSEASLQKKQVTFCSEYLGASSSSNFSKTLKAIKPSIRRYKNIKNISPATTTSSNDRIESLKWIGRKEHLQASQRMFSKLEVKKNCDRRIDETLSSCNRRKRRAPDKPKKAAVPAATPTTQLTPTTSNASSGTPTPQPKRRQPRALPRSLPTPPASTHSSTGTDRRRRSTVDFDQVLDEAKNYKFDRRKFSENSAEHVRFYNNLLKLQRMKLQERRAAGESKAPKKSNKSANSSLQKLKRVRALNSQLHQTVERLQSDIATISNYALEELNKMPLRDQLPDLPSSNNAAEELNTMPLLEQLPPLPDSNPMVSNNVAEELNKLPLIKQLQDLPKSKPELSNNAREKLKKIPLSAIAITEAATNAPAPVPDPAFIADAAAIASSPASIADSEYAAAAADAPAPASAPSPAPVPDSAPPAPAPAPVSSSAFAAAAAAAPVDVSQSEPDLCIAAYVTLAVNGESCEDQDAAIKQIAQLPTPSPEADQTSVLLAHEIEIATSNVPVYLLNGESRDVTTPLPLTSALSGDDVASEP
ncbi:hypothetical protein KR222_011312 [Zaprionus bogoriensis]|nr:hypothetical protein KR222_011312 [Zaprionus bogoriensis]